MKIFNELNIMFYSIDMVMGAIQHGGQGLHNTLMYIMDEYIATVKSV